MTNKRKNPKYVKLKLATKSEEEKRDEFLRAIQNKHLLNFLVERNPKELAKYVRFSGDLSNQWIRNIIADYLNEAKFKKGGGKRSESLTFYHEVNRLMSATNDPPTYNDWPFHLGGPDKIHINVEKWVAKRSRLPKGKAIEQAIENLRFNLSKGGGHDKYTAVQKAFEKERGAKLKC